MDWVEEGGSLGWRGFKGVEELPDGCKGDGKTRLLGEVMECGDGGESDGMKGCGWG